MDDFVIGAKVKVDGLVSASRHNGKIGTIQEVFPAENKVQVILDDDDKSNIKVAIGKLTLIPVADSMLLDARKASASAPASAPASLRKIPVVLLGEMHNDLRCAKDNLSKLAAIGIQKTMPSHLLLVSEGRCVNPCFQLFVDRFGLHDRILLEYHTLTKSLMLNKLLLETNTLQNILDGKVIQGTGAAAGPGIPDSQTVEPKWFMERAKEEYGSLLQVVPDGTTTYEQMVAAAFSRNTEQFYSFYNSILGGLIQSDYLNDIPMSEYIKRMLNSFIETKNDRNLREVSILIMSSRDADIIRKVEERARSENSTLKTIVIIFGAFHFDNLRTLIQRSDVLEFDSARSSNIKIGGKKMKKVKKRISKSHLTKKCNSKSKKYNSKSKKCKTHRK
jgi:hypothetical protein